MLRWGILGAAKIARDFLIPAMQLSRNGRVSALASRDPEKGPATAEQFNIPHLYESYEDLLASSEVDAIYIPLPTSMHVEWTKSCIAAHKHVLCEKPIAMHANEIDELIKLRDDTGLTVGEAFMVAHHPQWHLVRDSVQNGKLGEIKMVQGAFTYDLRDPNNMRNRPELGGGGLRDIGVYPVVTTRFVTGQEAVSASARIDIDPVFRTDRFASCRVDFPGFELDFYVATQMAARQRMVFHGRDGWLAVESPFNAGVYGMTKVVMRCRNQMGAEEFYFPSENQYRLQVENFADAVEGKTRLGFPLESSRENQRVIDMLFESAAG